MALHIINHYKIFNAIPVKGDISYEDLAQKVKIPTSRLRRILRHAMTNYHFYEPREGYVAHTGPTMAMVKAPVYGSWIAHNSEEVTVAISGTIEALQKYGDSRKPEESAFNVAMKLSEGQNAFTFFENDGEGEKRGYRQRRFGEAMQAMNAAGSFSSKYIVKGFDWARLRDGTVVDVSIHLPATSARG